MGKVKYVCLSDLHLGAEYSLLTNIDQENRPNPEEPSTTLLKFAAALRNYLSDLSPDSKPQLILMGDLLDMGFSLIDRTAMAFQRFVEVMFPKDEPAIFAEEIIFIPGNHDHHLWHTVKDQQFLNQLSSQDNSQVLEPLIEATNLFDKPSLPSILLTKLVQSYSHLEDFSVVTAYPNFGLLSKEDNRCVLLHHGHFIENMYRLPTEVARWLLGTDNQSTNVSKLERQNGEWIDFLWSSLGNAGLVGDNLIKLYDIMHDPSTSHMFSEQLSDKLIQLLQSNLPIGQSTGIKIGSHPIAVRQVVSALIDATLGRAASMERNNFLEVLSSSSTKGMEWYLNDPVYNQLNTESEGICANGVITSDVTFIFGHTHKPFGDEFVISKFKSPVKAYNTGGWTVDQPEMVETIGAASVFIDDELNVASLRLYNDPVNDVIVPVKAQGVGGYPDQSNSLLTQMQAVLDGNKYNWTDFSNAASDAISRRISIVRNRFFNPALTVESTREELS